MEGDDKIEKNYYWIVNCAWKHMANVLWILMFICIQIDLGSILGPISFRVINTFSFTFFLHKSKTQHTRQFSYILRL